MLSKQLQKQIEQEAKVGQHTYPGTDYGHGFNKGYDSGYKIAGEKYATLWQAAEVRAERYEKALKEIYGHAGFVPHKHEMITIAREALTPKTSTDEQTEEPGFDYKSRDWEQSMTRPASKEAIDRMKERWIAEGKRECPDCGLWFKSEGRCPECNPMG